MVPFVAATTVRFGDVDAAGIVFYPRYFEMLNTAIEDWFEHGLGETFGRLHLGRRIGVPTVKLEAEFPAPSLLGERLSVQLSPRRVGRSSCTIAFSFTGDGVARVTGVVTIVCMDLDKRLAVPWPDDLRAGMVASRTL
ncbi:acyl-CoA thioesterase [Sphingomonas sp.]|uniref:acyl-CoA thioesterase n=1 Tax=Sphingomonas sp. TaxID=28214 RepID=UPI002DD692DA|nr:thioesterase family protein [Sphingomonas sp.]